MSTRTNWDYTALAAHYDGRADYAAAAVDQRCEHGQGRPDGCSQVDDGRPDTDGGTVGFSRHAHDAPGGILGIMKERFDRRGPFRRQCGEDLPPYFQRQLAEQIRGGIRWQLLQHFD